MLLLPRGVNKRTGLATLLEQLKLSPNQVAAIGDSYPAALSRCAREAPKAAQVKEAQGIFDDKEIKAVIVATPTRLHQDLALGALKAVLRSACSRRIPNRGAKTLNELALR